MKVNFSFYIKTAKKFNHLFACVSYKLNGDGLLPTFSRCVREPAVNVAGTEVIVTLLVIILVLAVVAGFLGYQWRLQGGRVSFWASRDEFVSRVYNVRHFIIVAFKAPGNDATNECRSIGPTRRRA